MLGKLVKYDLKWTYKFLMVFYVLAIFFALVGRGLGLIENSAIFSFLSQFSCGISVALMFNIIINNVIRLWVRFINNIYKDEAYLTHTLPVKKSEIYFSKVITASITLLTSIIVVVISFLICFYSKDLLLFIKGLVTDSVFWIFIELAIVLFLELLFLQFLGFLAITIGFRSNNNKIISSIACGFGLYMLSSAISVVILLIVGVFNSNIMELFFTQNPTMVPTILKQVLFISIIIYVLYIVISNIVAQKILKLGVNVD